MGTFSGDGSGRRGPSRARWLSKTVALGALATVASGCVSQEVAHQVDRRLDYGMTTAEVVRAREVALGRVRAEDAQVTARATVSEADTPTSSGGRPAPCTSGRLLHITLSGRFPHRPFADAAHTARVSGEVLTADARTGRVCEDHYVTGTMVADLTSVLLFSTLG